MVANIVDCPSGDFSCFGCSLFCWNKNGQKAGSSEGSDGSDEANSFHAGY